MIRHSNIFAALGLALLLSTQSVSAQYILQQRVGGSSLSLSPSVAPEKTEDPKATEQTVDSNLGFVSLSTKEKKAEFNLYDYRAEAILGGDFFWGISTAGELKNSIVNVLKSGDAATGVNASIRFGLQLYTNRQEWETRLATANQQPIGDREAAVQAVINAAPPANDLWFVTNAGFSGSKFNRFTPENKFDKQIQKQTFSGADVSAGLNWWFANLLESNCTALIGATFGYKQTNNFDKLDESTREDTRTITDSTTNTIRKIVMKETVYAGKYETADVFPLVTDVYLAPHRLKGIGILLSQTTNFSRALEPRTTPSLGLFFLKDANPFTPVAGISIGYYDVYNNDASDNDKKKSSKWTISLITRIKLFQNQPGQ